MKSKKDSVIIPIQVLEDAFLAMTALSSLLHATLDHKRDFKVIKMSLCELGGLELLDRNARAILQHLPTEHQARLRER